MCPVCYTAVLEPCVSRCLVTAHKHYGGGKLTTLPVLVEPIWGVDKFAAALCRDVNTGVSLFPTCQPMFKHNNGFMSVHVSVSMVESLTPCVEVLLLIKVFLIH